MVMAIGGMIKQMQEIMDSPEAQAALERAYPSPLEGLLKRMAAAKLDHPVVDAVGRLRNPSPRHPMDLIRMVDGA